MFEASHQGFLSRTGLEDLQCEEHFSRTVRDWEFLCLTFHEGLLPRMDGEASKVSNIKASEDRAALYRTIPLGSPT